MTRPIVVGGDLAGLGATHTVLARTGSGLILDKKPSLGGSSVKASSGINGAGCIGAVFKRYIAASAGHDLTRAELITSSQPTPRLPSPGSRPPSTSTSSWSRASEGTPPAPRTMSSLGDHFRAAEEAHGAR
ncbi:hypothetical protein C8R45DRAFT_1221455 [Mycena sanguinolenta]|nr:hypothetical protein C8R45DRAFT_1221455 [Mycena sanguinolenta]